MAIDRLKLETWGPKKLRKIITSIEQAINTRSPIEGLGIKLEERPDGRRINTEEAFKKAEETKQGQVLGGSGSSTTADFYGAYNGAPALFHLLQSSAPTPIE